MSAVSSWGCSLDEDLRLWAGAGIDHVGLSFRKLEETGLDAAVDRVRAAGLRVSNLVELGWCDLADAATWPAQRARLTAATDVAAEVGGVLVITTGPGWSLGWEGAASAFGEMLAPVREHARTRGVAVTVEPTGPLRLDLSFVTTVRDGIDLAREHGIGVCVELNSSYAERGLLESFERGSDVVRHVQVSDFVVGSLSTPDRAVPGDGDIPLERLVAGIAAAGYEGAFELELVGPRIEEEGYASAIRRSVAHLGPLLERALGQPSA